MYSRFKALETFGDEELQCLHNSKVAVVGLGSTGSVIAEHLARHGVELIVFDRDYLEENDIYSSNIYTPEHVEKALPKSVAAEKYLQRFTEIESFNASLNPENIDELERADLIVDGTDNMETRFLVNEFSKKHSIPWIYTAALGEKGYSMFFNSNCFNCVFEQVAPGQLDTCETSGILREVSTAAASLSSIKAIRYLTGKDVDESLETVSGRSFEVRKEGCNICEDGEFNRLNSERSISDICGEKKYQVEKDFGENAFKRLRERADTLEENEYLMKAEVNGRNFTLFRSGRAIVDAEDQGHAESLVSEIIGV